MKQLKIHKPKACRFSVYYAGFDPARDGELDGLAEPGECTGSGYGPGMRDREYWFKSRNAAYSARERTVEANRGRFELGELYDSGGDPIDI